MAPAAVPEVYGFLRRSRIKHLNWTLFVVFWLLTGTSVITTGIFYNKTQADRVDNQGSAKPNDGQLFNEKSAVELLVGANVELTNFDPVTGLTYGIDFVTVIYGDDITQDTAPLACVFADDASNLDSSPPVLSIDQRNVDPKMIFATNTTGNRNAKIESGVLARYPFDTYTFDILVTAMVTATAATDSSSCNNLTAQDRAQLVPTAINVAQSVPGFLADFSVKQVPDLDDDTISSNKPSNTYMLTVTVRRDPVIRFFAVVTFAVIWLLTGVVLMSTGQILLYHTEPRFELIGASTALLFALPQIRQAQPGMPLTPTVSDTVGYFWWIAMLGISTFALLCHSMWQMRIYRYLARHGVPHGPLTTEALLRESSSQSSMYPLKSQV